MKKRTPNQYELESQKRIKWLIDEYCDGQQIDFANKVGIGKSSVSQYVNGTNFPNNKTSGIIGKAFNLNPAWIMGFDVSKEVVSETTNAIESIGSGIENLFGLHLSEKERRIILAYRNASDKDRRTVDAVLELDVQSGAEPKLG